MRAQLGAELMKVRTVRAPWLVGAVAVALSGVIGFAGARISADTGDRLVLAQVAAAPMAALWFLAVVVAVLAGAGEFQHRTIRSTLLVTPRRGTVLAAKAAASATLGALLVLAGGVAAVAAATVTAALTGQAFEIGGAAGWLDAAGGVAVGAVWAVLATGLGVLVRSTAIAVVAVLLWYFVVEGAIPSVTGNAELGRWTPTGAAGALIGAPGDTLPIGSAVLVLGGYVAVGCTAAALAFLRRDPA